MPSNVVLPEPDSPITATLSPALISTSTAAKITSPSPAPSLDATTLDTCRATRTGVVMRGVVLLLLAVSVAVAAETSIDAKTLLVVGDSISAGYGIQRDQGWVSLLERRGAKQQPPFTVVNASISGDTTGGALARLPRTLEIHKPNVVVI